MVRSSRRITSYNRTRLDLDWDPGVWRGMLGWQSQSYDKQRRKWYLDSRLDCWLGYFPELAPTHRPQEAPANKCEMLYQRVIKTCTLRKDHGENTLKSNLVFCESFNFISGILLFCDIRVRNTKTKMGVNEEDVVNIMGGMEHAGGIKLNDHKRKLKNRWDIRGEKSHSYPSFTLLKLAIRERSRVLSDVPGNIGPTDALMFSFQSYTNIMVTVWRLADWPPRVLYTSYYRFEICKKLGQGTYGKVQLGINKETAQRVSIVLFYSF